MKKRFATSPRAKRAKRKGRKSLGNTITIPRGGIRM